jgi:hypothetical protein
VKRLSTRKLAAACAMLVAAVFCVSAAAAQPVRDALRVDDWGLSAQALDVLRRAAVAQDAKASTAAVAAAVVQDHVLGSHAHRQVADEQLFDDARVAFSLGTSAQATLVATLERVYGKELAAAMSQQRGFSLQAQPLSRERLSTLLGPGTTLKLDDRLTAEQEAAMSRVMLAELRLGTTPAKRISLMDVWRELDVTGRNRVTNLDIDFTQRQALRMARGMFVVHWAREHGGLSGEDLDRLSQLMADRERRLAFERLMGASVDPHHPGAEFDRLRREVSREDIAAYWEKNPQQFQRIERVKARHIRCADEACIQAASAALAKGEAFDAVARKFSTSASRSDGGSLGWIEPSQARGSWLLQFALAQPPGPPSPPVREPENGGTPGWQIVQVDERVTGVHPVDSETVRFEASQAIARRRAVEHYLALRDRLLAQARIDVDPALGLTPDELRTRRQR